MYPERQKVSFAILPMGRKPLPDLDPVGNPDRGLLKGSVGLIQACDQGLRGSCTVLESAVLATFSRGISRCFVLKFKLAPCSDSPVQYLSRLRLLQGAMQCPNDLGI